MSEKLTLVDLNTTKIDPNGNMSVPAKFIPSFRQTVAMQQGKTKKLLFKTWGGLGDQICAEPTLRYALDMLTPYGYEISLDSMAAELFQHLPFHKIYDHFKEPADESEFYVFHTICSDTDFFWEYVCHLYTHCVDFASLIALRCQLPLAYKEITLVPAHAHLAKIAPYLEKVPFRRRIALHPGKHWQSKTFPKWWWDRVIAKLIKHGFTPILIGGHQDDKNGLRTTVDVDTRGCLDLRSKLSYMESVALLQEADVLLTNDSAPLHMAASGNAWIGFIALNKHPEFITHYRNGKFGWKMKNFGSGGVWETSHVLSDVVVTDIGENLEKWLPEPEDFAFWAIDKFL